MAYHFHFDADNRIILCTFEGDFTDWEMFGAVDTFRNSYWPRYGSAHVIGDHTRTTNVSITADGVRRIVRLTPMVPDGRVVVSVCPQDALYGMIRMYQLRSIDTQPHMRVVRTMDEALKLIGVQSPQFSPVQHETVA
jgi:hypothetical protein